MALVNVSVFRGESELLSKPIAASDIGGVVLLGQIEKASGALTINVSVELRLVDESGARFTMQVAVQRSGEPAEFGETSPLTLSSPVTLWRLDVNVAAYGYRALVFSSSYEIPLGTAPVVGLPPALNDGEVHFNKVLQPGAAAFSVWLPVPADAPTLGGVIQRYADDGSGSVAKSDHPFTLESPGALMLNADGTLAPQAP